MGLDGHVPRSFLPLLRTVPPSSRRHQPHPAARRLLRAGSPLALCSALWGRGACDCAAPSGQLHLPIDISASEEHRVASLTTLTARIEQVQEDEGEAIRHHLSALDLLVVYGRRIRGGRTALLRMAWDADERQTAARLRLDSLRAERRTLMESAPCLD